MRFGWFALTLGVALIGACAPRSRLPAEPLPPPCRASVVPVQTVTNAPAPARIETRREPLVETLFGKRVADPYRWLENGDDPAVKAWTAAQNRVTEHALGQLPARAALKARLEQLLSIGQVWLPEVRRTSDRRLRYFYTRRDGAQNQPVLRVRTGLAGHDRVLLDPNALNTRGTTSLDWFFPSRDGARLAYGTSDNGSEESTLRVRDVESGIDLPDVIERTRAATVCWMPDGRRFFYSRYPKPGSVPAGEEQYHRQIFEHTLGEDPARDRLVFGAGRALTDYPTCSLSPNGRWLVIRVHEGWNKSELFLADTARTPLEFRPLTAGKAHLYEAIVRDDVIYVHTNEGAPRYALYAVEPQRLARASWRQILSEHATDVLASVEVIGAHVLAAYLHDASSRLEHFDASGKSLGVIPLPTIGTSDGFSGLEDGDEAFFQFESFAVPPRIDRIDLKSGAVGTWQKIDAAIDPSRYAVDVQRARSRDGTRIPYTLVYAKGTKLDSGRNPTLLYGYGGFNLSVQPRFSRTNYALLERGVVYVQANLRGGGEFGEDWHRAGQLEKKQNVFDDFVAVAEDLIRTKVTSPSELAIFGRSNGGLLVSAALTQRPDLFRAAVSSVPLTDMLRYERFLIAKLWASEYGSASKPHEFEWLLEYSPYHRVREGTAYPAVLLTTAVSDTRVDPLHARKMAAALQAATSSGYPVLLRTELEAGHGAGKPMNLVADEFADIYAFLLWQLGALPSAPAR